MPNPTFGLAVLWDGVASPAAAKKLIDSVETFFPSSHVSNVALTAWSLPLGYQLSLIDELRVWVERALLHAGLMSPPQTLPETPSPVRLS